MLAINPSPDLRTHIEVFEVLGEWCVRVVEGGEERVSSFVLQSYAEAFAEGQRMRLGLDRVTYTADQPA